jgi:hypothetical protein
MKFWNVVFITIGIVILLFALEAYQLGQGAISIEQSIASGFKKLWSLIGLGDSTTTASNGSAAAQNIAQTTPYGPLGQTDPTA